MWNVRLDETQARIKIDGRNSNNFRYADDTTLTAEREEDLKSLLMKVKKESEKAGVKLYIEKTGIQSHHFLTNRWENNGNSDRLLFSWASKSLQTVTTTMKLKDACSLEEKLWET